jgi:hypothetical protein
MSDGTDGKCGNEIYKLPTPWTRPVSESHLGRDSVGRWGGDMLVVDTVKFNGRIKLDTVGHPVSDQLHVPPFIWLGVASDVTCDATRNKPVRRLLNVPYQL